MGLRRDPEATHVVPLGLELLLLEAMVLPKVAQVTKQLTLSWIRRVNIVKMTVHFKLMDKFNAVPIKVYACFYAEINKQVSSKMYMEL